MPASPILPIYVSPSYNYDAFQLVQFSFSLEIRLLFSGPIIKHTKVMLIGNYRIKSKLISWQHHSKLTLVWST